MPATPASDADGASQPRSGASAALDEPTDAFAHLLPQRMRRGEIWTVGDRSDLRYRVLVLTGDAYNDRDNVAPLCAPIVRVRADTDLPAYAVPLAEQDPITGVVI